MTALETRKQIQTMLDVTPDGDFRTKSLAALHQLINTPDEAQWPVVTNPDVHVAKASSFADPADVASFRRCKAQGKTDQECFKVGDNGVGKWGDDCTEGSGPSCALPPEIWQAKYGPGNAARFAPVLVTVNGVKVRVQLKDTMPHLANITNGAGIDLNPDACKALGLHPPVMVEATWQWAS